MPIAVRLKFHLVCVTVCRQRREGGVHSRAATIVCPQENSWSLNTKRSRRTEKSISDQGGVWPDTVRWQRFAAGTGPTLHITPVSFITNTAITSRATLQISRQIDRAFPITSTIERRDWTRPSRIIGPRRC